jgi:hypothetical protein
MMRKATPSEKPGVYFLVAVTMLLFNAVVFAQVVENPAKPKAANAGRVVVPQQVLAITDEGTSDYYFKRPGGLRTAPDGALILLDRGQVLQFDKNGKFLRNLFKKGQGPGEVTNVSACLPIDKYVVVQSPYPNKLVFFDYSGKYEKEIPVRKEAPLSMEVLNYQGGVFYFQTNEFQQAFEWVKGGPDIIDVPRTIVALNDTTGETRMLSSFPTKAWVVHSPEGGGGLHEISILIAVPFRQRLLALVHTSEYLIKIYDPTVNKVVGEFRRAYERVKGAPLTEAEKQRGLIIGGNHYTRPEMKFENDVKNVLARGDEIWAVTSTKDKAKGVLIDVFDGEGAYRDCFWLKLPEAALENVLSPGQCALDGDFLWVVERAEDETATIKKYRISI